MPAMDADATLNNLGGGFGKYQLFLASICALTTFFNGQPVVQDSFVNYTPDHRCYVPSCDSSNTTYDEPFLNYTTPWSSDGWAKCEYNYHLGNVTLNLFGSKLSPYQLAKSFSGVDDAEIRPLSRVLNSDQCSPDDFDVAETQKCDDGWVYDRELFQSSTTMDFDFVCDRSYLTSMTASAYNLGMLFGAVLCGVMADKLGRKFAYMVSLALMVVGGTLGALSVNPIMLIIMRMPTGFGAVALFQIVFILCAEYMPSKYRSVVGFVLNISFAIGEAGVGVYAIFIRHWRALQLTIAVPPAVMFIYIWIMPESVRWLSSEGRDAEAQVILKRMARVNGSPEPTIVYVDKTEEETQSTSQEGTSVWEILKYSNMRKRSLVLFYTWFTASMVYYGISQNSANLAGNIFVNFITTMLIEIPSYLLVALLFDKAGHKISLVVAMTIAGISCTATAFIPSEHATAIVVLSLIGKFGGAAVFGSLYVYASELYPTSHRSTGLGCCSMFSRVAGIIAPNVALLGKTNPALPLLVFGSLALISSVAMLFLPETTGCRLTQTLSESELMGADQPFFFCPWCTAPETETEEEQIESGLPKLDSPENYVKQATQSVQKTVPKPDDGEPSRAEEKITKDSVEASEKL